MILYWFLLAVVALFAGTTLLPVSDLLAGDRVTLAAYLYLGLCSIAFLVGYALLPWRGINNAGHKRSPLSSSDTTIPMRHMMLLALIAAAGLAVLLLQINATVGLLRYFVLALAASGDAANQLRYYTVMLPSSEGGYPGYIKMLNWGVVVAPFSLLALMSRGYRVRGRMCVGLGVLIGMLYLAGTLLRMDRLSVLALAPVTLSVFRKAGKRGRAVALVGIALLLASVVVQSVRRSGGQGMMGWASLYLQLGMVNLSLLMKARIHYAYGLSGIFSFAAWIFKAFGIYVVPDLPGFTSSWDTAQNGFGYMFHDFGWFGTVVFFLAGIFSRRIDQLAGTNINREGEGQWRELQWILSYGAASIAVVPAYSGFDFWVLLIGVVVTVRYIVKSISHGQRVSTAVPGFPSHSIER